LKRFNAWCEDAEANPIHPSLRLTVYNVAVRNNPGKAVEALKKEWFTTKSIDGKMICLNALGSTKDEGLITSNLLPFLHNASPPAPASESVPAGDMHTLALNFAANSKARPLLWKHIQENWPAWVSKLGNPVVLDRFVQCSLSGFTTKEAVDEMDAFFADQDTKSFDRTLATVKDKVRGRAAYRNRDADGLKVWLKENGYM
jgi:hypothetical protein